MINTSGALYLLPADSGNIDRRETYRAITSTNLDYAVKSAMCDGKGAEWTDVEKANAQKRIGVNGDLLTKYVEITTETQGFLNVQVDSASNLFIAVSVPANSSMSAGSIVLGGAKQWVAEKTISTVSYPVVASATYARIATVRAYQMGGFWRVDNTAFGGAIRPNLQVEGYDNYNKSSVNNIPTCNSILFNFTDMPIGTIIKIWGF